MITIDREQPTFVARAIGVLTGHLHPDSHGLTGTIVCRDGARIPVKGMMHGAKKSLLTNPALFGAELDFLVWPKTIGFELTVTIVRLEKAAEENPDRDQFLIQGMSLYRQAGKRKTMRFGIKSNSSHRTNTSNFDRFWISVHGTMDDYQPNVVYQVQATRRKGDDLLLLKEAKPHIRIGRRWHLSNPERSANARRKSYAVR